MPVTTTTGRTTASSANWSLALGSDSRTEVSRTNVRWAGSSGASWVGRVRGARCAPDEGLADAAALGLVDERRVVANSDSLGTALPLRLTLGPETGTGTTGDGWAGSGPPSGAGFAPWVDLPNARRVPCVSSDGTTPGGACDAFSTARRDLSPDRHRPLSGRSGHSGHAGRDPRGRSGAVAALPLGVGAQRPQEVDVAEVGPVGLAELELTVGALPQQEPPEPLLPGGADHQVGVGLALGVEVLGDVLDVEDLGELLDRGPPGGVLLQHRADGVGDLAPTAVADRDVDQQAVDVAGRIRGLLELVRRLGRQQVQRADGVEPPAAGGGQPGDGGLDDPQQRGELGGGTVEVVGGQQPEGDDLDADLLAPTEQRGDVVRTGL